MKIIIIIIIIIIFIMIIATITIIMIITKSTCHVSDHVELEIYRVNKKKKKRR